MQKMENVTKKQTKFKIRPQIEKDDCWRTAIANILQLEPRKVPHFIKLYKRNYIQETHKWLETRGKGMVYVPLSAFIGRDEWSDNYSQIFPSGYAIASMSSKKIGHVDIVYNGKLMRSDIDDNYRNFKKINGYFIIYDLIPQ